LSTAESRVSEEAYETSEVLRAAWLKALGTNDARLLRRRLEWDGVSGTNVAIDHLLPGSDINEPDLFPEIQNWLRESARIRESDWVGSDRPIAFAELWHRIASGAMKKLAESLPEEVSTLYQAERHTWDALQRNLSDHLAEKLAAVGEGALWQKFNTRRTPEAVVLAHVRAQTGGRQRLGRTVYCSFLEEVRSDGLQTITNTYPVLRRHLSTVTRQWLRFSAEVLIRVHSDRRSLLEAFGLPSDATLVAIRQGVSDPHRGGQTVAMLSFASASSSSRTHTVVYKPKDLRIDRAFQSLVASLPRPCLEDRPLRSITVVVREGYGYMEHVPHQICSTDEELQVFYRNAGRLTALLHLLGCTDGHHENLIACAADLVLVDAETLFEPLHRDDTKSSDASGPSAGLFEQIGNSVLRLGLLPQWEFIGTQRAPRDVSALGIDPPSGPQRTGIGWIDLNTDGMRAGAIEEPANVPLSLPVGTGSPNRLRDFVEELCGGFESQLLAIAGNRDQWLADDGPLSRFRQLRRRYVPRPTWLYGWLLGRQVDPGSLRSDVHQRLTLETLARSYLVFPEKPRDWPLFAAEVDQLESFDIPYFEQSLESLDLPIPDGELIPNYFRTSGYEHARDKIRQLDRSTIDLQLDLIRGVIAAKNRLPNHSASGNAVLVDEELLGQLSDEDRAAEAEALGRLLVETAIADEAGALEWLGVDVAADFDRSRYGALGPSLYSGRAGITLFVAALARRGKGDGDLYRQTALGASSDLLSAVAQDESFRWWRDQPLGLNGAGGALLTLLRLGTLLPGASEDVARKVSSLLEALSIDRLRADRQADIMGGGAGLIGPLLEIGTPMAIMLAREAGDNLVGRQDACGGWVIDAMGTSPLAGFSHGASGIAAALARLHAVTGQNSYRQAAEQALRYEQDNFDPVRRNWPDFREGNDSRNPRFMLGWCHGAPGVALSRMCLLGTSLWNARREAELQDALTSTADPHVAGDSVCCGRFGRAAILRLAARLCDEPRWLGPAALLERQALTASRVDDGYSFGDALGLFNGAAGVGLALLDATSDDGDQVLPSLLSAGLCGGGLI
jgi:type 2 lantibiotic biosynthesis protein LanM